MREHITVSLRCVCTCEEVTSLGAAPRYDFSAMGGGPDGDLTMKTAIKLALLAVAGTALLAAPASAAQPHRRPTAHSLQYSPAPGVFQNDTVIEGGQYLGRDPDPNVRGQLLKDDSEYEGNSY
jgi:hypothetical protein